MTIYSARFKELLEQLSGIEQSKRRVTSDTGYGDDFYIERESIINWKVKAKNILVKACGSTSEHYLEFLSVEKPQSFRGSVEELKHLRAVFLAAQEDYDGGYLVATRNLIQAEVFSDELDQAVELQSSGYSAAAAVIAGTVLETTLRQLCNDNGVQIGKVEKMNSDLAKAGVYNSLTQKQITAHAAIRNSAAHGNKEEFRPADVSDMIRYVTAFVSEHLK